MSFVLDTPEQIGMWVLLSRRAQLKMQLGLRPDGTEASVKIPTKGLVKWFNRNIPGAEKARTAKQCIVPLEYAISEARGEIDFSYVNVHVMVNRLGMFFDQGVYPDLSVVEENEQFVADYAAGDLELVLTLEAPREANNEIYVPA